MKCKSCGYENKEGAKFCNQCGAKLDVDEEKIEDFCENNNITTLPETTKGDNQDVKIIDHMKKKKYDYMNRIDNLSTKKKAIIGVLASFLLFICVMGCAIGWQSYKNYQYETGNGLTYDKKKSNLETQLILGEYDKAKQLSSIYKVHENDIDKIIQKYKDNKNNKESKDKILFLSDVENVIAKEEKQNACTVISQNIKKNGNYYYGECEVKNNSKNTINYVRVEIYYYDKDYNQIDSDYTNSSTKISVNATKKLEWMTKYDSRYAHCVATVSEFN